MGELRIFFDVHPYFTIVNFCITNTDSLHSYRLGNWAMFETLTCPCQEWECRSTESRTHPPCSSQQSLQKNNSYFFLRYKKNKKNEDKWRYKLRKKLKLKNSVKIFWFWSEVDPFFRDLRRLFQPPQPCLSFSNVLSVILLNTS